MSAVDVRFRRELVAARRRPPFARLGTLQPDVVAALCDFAARHARENILAEAMANRADRQLSSGDAAYLTAHYAQIELQHLRKGGDPETRTDYTDAADPALMTQIEAIAGPCHRTRITRLDVGGDIARHIDDPRQIRIIATLAGSDRMTFHFDDKTKTLPSKPGELWFINTAFEHAVVNDGQTPRIALIANANSFNERWIDGR